MLLKQVKFDSHPLPCYRRYRIMLQSSVRKQKWKTWLCTGSAIGSTGLSDLQTFHKAGWDIRGY